MTATAGNFPSNINPLNPNGFRFDVAKLKDISFYVQSVNLPGITLGEPIFGNPFAQTPVPGDMLTYGELSFDFIVDEDMKNYETVYKWIVALGFPTGHDQYLNFINSDESALIGELAKNYSDATLTVLNNNNQPSKYVRFIDCFPTSLDALQFDSKVQDVQYLVARTSFRFTYYKFVSNRIEY